MRVDAGQQESRAVAVDLPSEAKRKADKNIEMSGNHPKRTRITRQSYTSALSSEGEESYGADGGDGPRPIPTIEFEDVYQNGRAKAKRCIIKFKDEWFVFMCDEHDSVFSSQNPLDAARSHGREMHSLRRLSREQVVKIFGYRVEGCNPQLAADNNTVFFAAKERSSPYIMKLHVLELYSARCSDQLLYPVMLVDKDTMDFPDGNRHSFVTLVGSGALALPPNDHFIRDNKLVRNEAYDDGGKKAIYRRFPVYVFNGKHSFEWVRVKDLYPLNHGQAQPHDSQSRLYDEARRWLAQQKGFQSWSRYQRCARDGENRALVDTGKPV